MNKLTIMRHLTLFFLLIWLVAFTFNATGQPDADTLSFLEKYQQDLSLLTSELDKEGYEISSLMEDDRFEVYGSIDERFTKSAERTTPTLEEYKEILDFDKKVDQGVEFLEEYSSQLRRAEEEYGISRYIITAIIGVESKYGNVLGDYNPFNVYISMIVVDYRADFARAQLKELIEFTNRKQIDVFTLKSSYAGAMSAAQFIPYSVNKWWVGDDIFDIDNNIMSVANYLAHFQARTNDLRTSVLRYNPSDLYADTILDMADAIGNRSTESE